MWFRIASLLGMTVEEAQIRMTYSEFLGWAEFYGIEPWGFHVQNLWHGITASTIDNCRMTSKPRTQFAKPKDYMVLQRDTPKKEVSIDDINAKLFLSGMAVIDKREKK